MIKIIIIIQLHNNYFENFKELAFVYTGNDKFIFSAACMPIIIYCDFELYFCKKNLLFSMKL
ncbi:hypothetical protein BpHYR1_049761 [Brachionus plicatilis]|uniref:Uncharacterized protein n=1 Tax=Brachionus plicatilis TaxID=10195 RepID=A0A3M7RTU4_BRAPC|nr:hypothetical protein BpHYR1_049761 [Brachionus plicatilis]